ncbi:xanthine dehydrogenase family protein molybdopterin-binding subunit [Chloroflexota bacterium]
MRLPVPPDDGTSFSHQEWGDVNKGFGEADATVAHEVRTSRIYGSFCPPACIAEWAGDKLTLFLSHQCPFEIRSIVSDTLDMPENKVRVIVPKLAVTNGMLNSAQRFWYLAALLSKNTGRPVVYKMTIEEFGVYKSKEADLMRLKLAGKKDGTVTALDYTQLHDNGGYGYKSCTYHRVHAIFSNSTSVSYDAVGVCTNKVSTGCIRGVGNVPQTLALNQAMDMLAEKLEVDPLTFWKKNHHKAGDPIYTAKIPGFTCSSEAYDELIDKGAISIEWVKKWKGWGKPYQVMGSKKKGVGMALGLNASGVPALLASSIVEVNHDGTAQVLIGSTDLGSNSKTTFAQVCAEVLGLRIEDVSVVEDVDTETVPFMAMTGASISMHVGGSAVKIAAADAKRLILEMAHTAPWSPDSLKEGVKKPEDLDIKESMIYVKANPDIRVPVKQIVSSVLAPQVIGRAPRHDIPCPGPIADITMVGFADVEVDTETGTVNVLKLILGNDSGRIINPEVCKNQVYGGGLMSFGYALMEEVAFDPATGKVLNPALIDYWMPGVLDAPPMEIIFSDSIDPIGPLGAKGIGEGGAVYPHAAIASAIYNALGVRVNQLPITPDRVLRALGKIR